MESRSRPTICDGEVITYAESFESSPGICGDRHEARGPYEVSVSRNAIIVHRANIKSADDLAALQEALKVAGAEASRLSRKDWGGDYRRAKQPHEIGGENG